jgi:TolB protein
MRHAVLASTLCLAAAGAGAQPDEVHVGTRQGIERFRLSVAAFAGPSEAEGTLRRVVRDDLALSGLLDVVGEAEVADYRLSGMLELLGDEHVVTVTLREARDDGPVLFGKRYRGTATTVRRIAHKVADEVIKALTGRPGCFDSRIAFVAKRGARQDVHVMDYDGANVARVTSDGALVLSPEVSADGRLLLFTSYVSRDPAVYLVTRETGEIRRLFRREGLNQSPTFAPDGRHVAFSATFDGNSEIYVSDLAGAEVRRLTDHPAIDVSPCFSPTGGEIAFVSDRGGTPQVHVMTAEGLDVRRVTLEGSYNTDPAWSPDGTRLAYASRQAGRFRIAVLDLASGEVTILAGEGNDEAPAWSPDGELIAFMSDRTGAYDIHVMRRDGQGARRVGPPGENKFPSWYR